MSQETHYVSATKANRLMLFTDGKVVYCESHMKQTETNSVGRIQISFVH
jgi:hypothetical protein